MVFFVLFVTNVTLKRLCAISVRLFSVDSTNRGYSITAWFVQRRLLTNQAVVSVEFT